MKLRGGCIGETMGVDCGYDHISLYVCMKFSKEKSYINEEGISLNIRI